MTPDTDGWPGYHDALDGVAPPCASTQRVGHDRACAHMLAIVRAGHHAILLDGQHGIGKATAAFHLANALVSGPAPVADALPAPDPRSPAHRQIARGAHPNLVHLTRPRAATGTGFKTVITIDEVRRVQHFLSMTASADQPRIVIVDPVGDMQRPAANALLKTLEEPPHNTLFLLISHGAGGLLATIRSRCQRVRFDPLDDAAVAQVVRRVGGGAVADGDVETVAARAAGRPRQALTLALFGGGELRDGLDRLLAAPRFETQLAHTLADVAGARGNDTQNGLLREMMADALKARAREAARAGDLRRADRIAAFAADLSRRFAEADAFGLDRKQEFLVAGQRVHALMHAG